MPAPEDAQIVVRPYPIREVYGKGPMMGDSAVYCLSFCGHQSGVSLAIDYLGRRSADLIWVDLSVEEKLLFKDTKESVQFGAYGIAFLVLHYFYKGFSLERSAIGSGHDWWLTMDDPTLPFVDPLRLEVSGILSGAKEVPARLRRKMKQTRQGTASGCPTLVAVVEFSAPSVTLRRVE